MGCGGGGAQDSGGDLGPRSAGDPADGGISPAQDGAARDGASADAQKPADSSSPAEAARVCPAGLGARWTCNGTGQTRERCVDGVLRDEVCAYGCGAGAGGDDATCACGPNAAFSLWNCLADGDLYACPGGIYAHRTCANRGCTAAPRGSNDTCNAAAGSLAPIVAQLATQCGQYSPGTTCGIAVRDLVTGETASARGDVPYVSASSAKAIWVAAALYDTSIAQVAPHADPIFRASDNVESGKVIDLLASPARVNTFMWNDVGLATSGFCHWSYGGTREAANCPQTMSGDNFFTANDAVAFLTALWSRSLLGEAATTAELEWMTHSPRSGYGGWLGTQLPAAARATMHHKAGWLPPDVVPGYSNSNEIGIVEPPGAHAYAVALLLDGGSSYDAKQLPTLEYASCAVYHAVTKDVPDPFAPCTHP